MPIDFKLPDLGENVTSGDVVAVLVGEGDVIQSGQGVIEMETEKAVAEVPCPHGGRVVKIHVSKGDTLRVGATVLTLEPEGAGAARAAADDAPAPKPKAEKPKPKPAPAPARKAEAARPAPQEQEEAESVPFTPRSINVRSTAAGPGLRRLARELGVDLNSVEGSGPGGRLTKSDIEAAARKLPARQKPAEAESKATADADKWGPIRREPLTQIRKAIARQMTKAASTIPQVTHCDDADVTDLDRIRKTARFEDLDPPVKVTLLPFILKAIAHVMKDHPAFNASFDEENEQIIYKEYVSVGVAVDTDRGLIVPVLRNVDQMDVLELAYAVVEAADKVKTGRFNLEDIHGGTFTVSNVGAYGGTYSTPIINYPEVAILLVGRGRMTPIWKDGQFQPRLMLPLSLSYDHRVIDGAMAARFMRELVWYLESPGRLLLLP